jgi:CRISPR/Cas system-associated exonuclease Cas4 (RecB family)
MENGKETEWERGVMKAGRKRGGAGVDEPRVGGALVASYAICQRQVWFMGRNIVPNQSDENLEYGRFLHHTAYARERKDVVWEGTRFDWVKARDGELDRSGVSVVW